MPDHVSELEKGDVLRLFWNFCTSKGHVNNVQLIFRKILQNTQQLVQAIAQTRKLAADFSFRECYTATATNHFQSNAFKEQRLQFVWVLEKPQSKLKCNHLAVHLFLVNVKGILAWTALSRTIETYAPKKKHNLFVQRIHWHNTSFQY